MKQMIRALVAFSLCLFGAGVSAFEVRTGYRVIDSIPELRLAMTRSDQKVRMKPGTYRVTDALADNQTVFLVSGSNNAFDLRGVTIQVETRVLAEMTSTRAHQLATYRIHGHHLTFEGATFENVGDLPPQRSLSEFALWGDHITFRDCVFIVRGSDPYGYGERFGKGRERSFPRLLQKHSAMSVNGDHTRIIGCRFGIYAFGHAIHVHGGQDTLVRDTYIEGELRSTDDLLAETSGEAFDLGFTDMWGRPIPGGRMLALAEDGIRAYTRGTRDGVERRTGKITVINCHVHRMRGSVALSLAGQPAVVTGTTVTEAGWTGFGYGLPSGSVVRDSRGDAAFAPLLNLTRSNRKGVDVELEVLSASRYAGDHPLAIVNGEDHRVRLTTRDPGALPPELKIVCGFPTRNDGRDRDSASCSALALVNETGQPVVMSERAHRCRVTTEGAVVDEGSANEVERSGGGR